MNLPRAGVMAVVAGVLVGVGSAAALTRAPMAAVGRAAAKPPVAAAAVGGAAGPASSSNMPLATPLLRAADGPLGPPGLGVAGQSVSAPVRLRIAAIGVDAGLGRVGLQADGTIAVPSDWNQPAWYTDGPAPGAQGPAVIVGHLDSETGPAVFWQLDKLKPGDEIAITRQDGSAMRFRVTRVGVFARPDFPTGDVYGPTPDAQLRLITCGGAFDWSARRYSDNVVVFAEVE